MARKHSPIEVTDSENLSRCNTNSDSIKPIANAAVVAEASDIIATKLLNIGDIIEEDEDMSVICCSALSIIPLHLQTLRHPVTLRYIITKKIVNCN